MTPIEFSHLRYGMFVHFGLFSLLGRGEWAMNREGIPREDYASLTRDFNPHQFDAGAKAPLVVRVVENVGLEYRKTPLGFTAVVTVPLQLLNWTPKPGQTVKMDIGYLFGNATGNMGAARSYWNNNSFSANVVNDVPHESRLEPAEWGEAKVN